MKSAYSTTSLPTTTATNLPLSMPNANQGKSIKNQQHQEQKAKFIWKEPPNLQIPLTEEEDIKHLPRENTGVVMRGSRGGGGPVHKRKDLHHTRRHTLQGGVDFSMVREHK